MKNSQFILIAATLTAPSFAPYNHLLCMEPSSTKESSYREELSEEEKNALFDDLYTKLMELFSLNNQSISLSKQLLIRQLYLNKFIFPKITFNENVSTAENNKKLQEVFDIVFKMNWLYGLDLNKINLDSVPQGISRLKNLITISLSGNNLKTIPGKVIRSLKSLRDIDLSGNPMINQSQDQENWGIQEILDHGFVQLQSEKPLVFTNFLNKITNKEIFEKYTKYIYTDIPVIEMQRNPLPESKPITEIASSVIFNEDGIEDKIGFKFYDLKNALENNPEFYKKGSPLYVVPGTYEIPAHLENMPASYLKIDEDIPIGYQVYLPKGHEGKQITAIYVKVYGGNERIDLAETSSEPYINDLLNRGVVVIALNLLDLYELKKLGDSPKSLIELHSPKAIFQAHMPLELHQKLHLSIDYFLKVLKSEPNFFGIEKNQIQGKNIVLEGGSFGGLIAIKHAELYPGSFDGYISDDGVLDLHMWHKLEAKNFNIYGERGENLSDWLDCSPLFWIEKIKDPILLLQNFDDNNVGAQLTLFWYKKTKPFNKKIQLLVTPRGNPIPKSMWDLANKGHYVPTDQIAFQNYMDTVYYFLLHGPSKLGILSDWTGDKYDAYANAYLNKQYATLPLQDKFISWAWRLYNARPDEAYASRVHQEYPEEKDIPEKAKELMMRRIHKSWEMFENPDITNATIYDTLAFLEEIGDPKLTDDVLTDDVVRNILKYHLPLLIDYLKESNQDLRHVDFSIDNVIKSALEDTDTLETYRKWLTGGELDSSAREALIRILFIANPPMLDGFRKEKEMDKKYQLAKQEALKAFNEFVNKQTKKYPKKAWQETINQVREQFKRENIGSAMKKLDEQRQQKKMIETQGAIEVK